MCHLRQLVQVVATTLQHPYLLSVLLCSCRHYLAVKQKFAQEVRRLFASISNPFHDRFPLGQREPCGYGLSPRLTLYGLGAASFMIGVLFLSVINGSAFRAAIRSCRYPHGRVAVGGVVFVDENINLPALKNAPINTSHLSLLTPVYRGYCYREKYLCLVLLEECPPFVSWHRRHQPLADWQDFPLGTPVLRSVPYSLI